MNFHFLFAFALSQRVNYRVQLYHCMSIWRCGLFQICREKNPVKPPKNPPLDQSKGSIRKKTSKRQENPIWNSTGFFYECSNQKGLLLVFFLLFFCFPRGATYSARLLGYSIWSTRIVVLPLVATLQCIEIEKKKERKKERKKGEVV